MAGGDEPRRGSVSRYGEISPSGGIWSDGSDPARRRVYSVQLGRRICKELPKGISPVSWDIVRLVGGAPNKTANRDSPAIPQAGRAKRWTGNAGQQAGARAAQSHSC